jgi:hypothetical protein
MKFSFSSLPAAVALAALISLAACGGGNDFVATPADGAAPPAAAASSPVVPVLAAASAPVTVVMPTGVALTADKLSVVTSIGTATPAAGGAVTLPIYGNGAQLAIARSPAGKPMLMGWIDANHTTISAATTAHVLAYFALGGPLTLTQADRDALIDGMPTAPGISGVEAAVQAALAGDVDAFATRNAALTAAVARFANDTFTAARATPAGAGRVHALGITIDPQTQSGITVLEDLPYAAHLSNAYRRRAHAFVERISHAAGGEEVADPLDITDFDVDPAVGFTGGVTGAVTDLIASYYGVQPTAYVAVTGPNPPFALPLVANSEKTTYRVTVVGAGAFAGAVAKLTQRQSTALTEVAIRGFAKDFLIPFATNAVLGSGVINFKSGQTGDQAAFLADVTASVTSDFIAYIATDKAIGDKIVQGQWFDASVDLTGTLANLGALKSLLVKGFDVAVTKYNAAHPLGAAAGGLETGALSNFFDTFNNALNAAGGALQVFDATIYIGGVAISDRADQWTLNVTPAKVTLNPLDQTIDVGGTVVYTGSVLGTDTTGYSYRWITTATEGDLNEVAGGGRMHQSDYCSSSPQAAFNYKIGAVYGATDQVTFRAFAGSNCDESKLVGSATTGVTYQPKITASLSPGSASPKPGETVTFVVNSTGLLPPVHTFRWMLNGKGSIGGASPLTTTVPTLDYTAPDLGTDYLAVDVLDANGKVLASATSTITVMPTTSNFTLPTFHVDGFVRITLNGTVLEDGAGDPNDINAFTNTSNTLKFPAKKGDQLRIVVTAKDPSVYQLFLQARPGAVFYVGPANLTGPAGTAALFGQTIFATPTVAGAMLFDRTFAIP